ncbi:hypothetical protein [Rhodovulum sulfidophilum]|uniref:hypothetical protein n=1 Tax=Rhodovulum sulfidophilum TaxID=35806 RepID=UPI000952AC24|nr:hypothetical protein [Rhodovulum sulfidophilum]MBL3553941.1 hypothetical protein [Rhodovulum sulfidophilum]OLS46832.1 hypothetical protein BV379_00015 [Rhodovulum sulfidophilum]
MNFSDKIEADQDCLPCQHGNLFLSDMSAEMQSRLRFSGAVNGKTTETLPVGRVFQLENSADRTINGRSGGAAPRALTILESLALGHPGRPAGLTEEVSDEVRASGAVNDDRAGDRHHDVISALSKSMRGPDPDATLYRLARQIPAGADPRVIAQRTLSHVSEYKSSGEGGVRQNRMFCNTAHRGPRETTVFARPARNRT